MRRRLEAAGTFNVWPAFTDVLGGLVVVLVFLITIFVIGEVLIGRELTGKDTAIDQLARIIDGLERLVGESNEDNERLRSLLATVRDQLDERNRSLKSLERELVDARATQEVLDNALTKATADRAQIVADLRAATAALATTREQSENSDRELQLSTLQMKALQRRIADLSFKLERLNRVLYSARGEVAAGRSALARTEQELAAAGRREADLRAELDQRLLVIDEQSDRIEEMDRLIKRRLLDRVEELEKYSSDFFGRLREVFANNPDIKVEGDRFVFQSEVLFPSGASDLSFGGRGDLDKFVEVYRQVESKLPRDLPVIIEVQGHTDRVPIRTARFESNWELSTARALGVVNYLISKGVPPERLAAVGMGEYHPIDASNDPSSLRRNRRIELKITSR
jgi:chemotaxis protein MotB